MRPKRQTFHAISRQLCYSQAVGFKGIFPTSFHFGGRNTHSIRFTVRRRTEKNRSVRKTGQLNPPRFARLHGLHPCTYSRFRGSRFPRNRFSNKKADRLKAYLLFWCGKRDLNPYGVNHTPLKRARLPVPPLSLTDERYYITIRRKCQ